MHYAETMATGGGEEERNALTILWRIENLSCFDKKFHGNNISSPCFHLHTFEDQRTYLFLFPRGETVNDANVCLDLRTNSPFPVDCEFSFLTSDGSLLATRKGIRVDRLGWKFKFKMTDCLTQEELFVTKKSTFLHHDTLTVRCRLWKSEGNFQQKEFISACSRIEYLESSIFWPIGGLNLSQCETFLLRFECFLQSVRFDLKCSLTGESLSNSELSIEVTANQIPQKMLAKLDVSITDNRQEVMKLGLEENLFSVSKPKTTWVVPKLVLGNELREEMSPFTCGECLSLIFCFTAVCKGISGCIEKIYIGTSNLEQNRVTAAATFTEAGCPTSEQKGNNPARLQQKHDCLGMLGEDLFSLYQKQTFSDFELRSGDDCFPVHKSILCARSPVFSSMFSSKMDESNSKSLDVPDLDAHALNRLLTFMYTGNVETDLPLESAAKLYYAADKYQVDTLKRLCSSILQSQICVSNVSDILTLADRHQDSDLTSFVHTFILSHFDDVMLSKEWEKFLDVDPVLAGKSTHQLCKKKATKE